MAEADIDAVSAVRIGGWRTAYRGLMPQAYLDALSVPEDARLRRERFARRRPEVWELVADRDGEVAGWLAVGPAEDPGTAPAQDPGTTPAEDPRTVPDGAESRGAAPGSRLPVAELMALYVAPDLIGTGIGRTLLDAGTARARAHGYGAMSLWVVRGNARAERFYRRAGFAPDGAVAMSDVAGWRVPEDRYRRRLA
ncbi:acetyltransferase [Streptomyces sp. NRRL F-4489]|nr:GNAT family N-acetyltransferase [Streptomyces sp. NRRL F-4489]KUL51512.1 acetyltransferase [Streptomyces sp. NRRL F-4489]